jgi:Domain of unknown function (DUF4160)
MGPIGYAEPVRPLRADCRRSGCLRFASETSSRRLGADSASVRGAAHDGAVPRVSFFYGIVITMYFYDHQPPHFHAQYAEHHAVIAIDGQTVLVGGLPGRALKLVAEWATLHREELKADWELVHGGTVPEPIDPLP